MTTLAEILDSVSRFIRRFVVLPAAALDATVLWVAHTHALEAASATPYLRIWSATRQSGKTRLLEVLSLLVARPWFTGRVTAAVLVRKVAKNRPTLLLDETDAAFGSDSAYAEALRGILNTGHRRGGQASLCIPSGKTYDVVDFPTFCAKALAGLRRLPDTVEDRSILIRLKRRRPADQIERYRQRDAETEAAPLHQALSEWAQAELAVLQEARPELPVELEDRACDGWEPLLAIADLAGSDWFVRARRAALVLSTNRAPDQELDLGLRVLADIRTFFEGRWPDQDRISSALLTAALRRDEVAPWGSWPDKNGLTPHELAGLLRPFDIRPSVIRIGKTTPRGYRRADFEDAWSRFTLPTRSLHEQPPQQPSDNAGRGGPSLPQPYTAVAGARTGPRVPGDLDVAQVAPSANSTQHGPIPLADQSAAGWKCVSPPERVRTILQRLLARRAVGA